MASTLEKRLKKRRSRMENTELDDTGRTFKTEDGDEEDGTLQHFGSTVDIPSDEDVKEADDLRKDLESKHKEGTREMAKQSKSSREDIRAGLKSAKARTKAKLEESMKAASGAETADEADSKKKTRRKSSTPAAEAAAVSAEDGGVVEAGDTEAMEKLAEDSPKKPKMSAAERKAALLAKQKAKRAESQKLLRTTEMTDTLGGTGGADLGSTMGGDELTTTAPVRRFRGQRDTLQATRFDEAVNAEEAETQRLKVTARATARSETVKEVTWDDMKKKGWFSEDETMDFFTRQWESEVTPVAEEPPPPPPPPPEGADTTDEAGGTEDAAPPAEGDDAPLLDNAEPIDTRKFKASMDFYQLSGADYTPHETRVTIERELLFNPAAVELTMEEKMGEEFAPRAREEEGLYVGRRPVISKRNEQRLETRFLREGVFDWFGEDGGVKLEPDPLKEVPFRPLLWDEQDNPMPEMLQGDFKNPILIDLENRSGEGSVSAVPGEDAFWQLEVDVHSIQFTHHHLYSKEHVLAARLKELLMNLEKMEQRDWDSYCRQRLIALHRAVGSLEEQIEKNKEAGGRDNIVTEQMARVREYRAEISQTRRSRNYEGKRKKQTLRSVLRTWKAIKKERNANGYTNTDVSLEIRKQNWSRDEDEAAFMADVEEEVAEERTAFEEEYAEKMKQYEVQLKAYKEQKVARDAALGRESRREERRLAAPEGTARTDAALDEDDELQIESDEQVLAETELQEPEEPESFDEASVRAGVQEMAAAARRMPGEPEVQVKLHTSATVTPDSVCPAVEQRRRQHLLKCRYFVKILINNRLVETTELRELGSDFSLNFGIIYPVQIFTYPEVITLQIWEKLGFRPRLLADAKVPTPDSQLSQSKARVMPFDFKSSVMQTHSHQGIGCGVDFNFEGEDSTEGGIVQLNMAGKILSSAAWSEDAEGLPLAPPMQPLRDDIYTHMRAQQDPMSALGAEDAANTEKLAEWVNNANLDPNDPSNARLLRLLKPGGIGIDEPTSGGRVHAPQYFRLNHLQEEHSFASEEELQQNNRFKMIMYRDQEKEGFKGIKIPVSEKEIAPDTFKVLEDRIAEYGLQEWQDRRSKRNLRGFEARKYAQEQYVMRIRNNVAERFRKALHSKCLKDMVREEEVPNVGALIPMLMRVFAARRPLRPERTDRKAVPAPNVSAVDVSILVDVQGARNIPRRKGDNIVKPFVEVSFQEDAQRTSVADGPNPSWNAKLDLAFRPPAHITSLESVPDKVHINLFDEVRMEQVVEQRDSSSETVIRTERRWLGSLEIPFVTVYLNEKIEGTFRLKTPPILLGYVTAGSSPDENGPPLAAGEDFSTQLSVFITLDPPIRPPEPLKEKDDVGFDSREDADLLRRSELLLEDLEKNFPHRERKCTVVDQNCLEVFINRYLSPLAPPTELVTEDKNKSAQLIANYVFKIPFESDALAFPGLCDIWSTCEQFINMLSGDEEEHAVLLANYFRHLYGDAGYEVYLALGRAIPEGPTSYVMVLEAAGDRVWLWSSSTATKFDARNDARCPMRSIGCLVSPDNIWFNTQTSDQPNLLRYNLTNKKDWRTLFTPSEAAELKTNQKSKLEYQDPSERDVDDFKFKIEKALREKVMEWRNKQVTKWNRQLQRQLNSILESLEKNGGKANSDVNNHLSEITNKYEMSGFPLNMCYMEIDDIIKRVRGTGVHSTSAPGVEFALSVYIKAYRGGVLSIWIYVASLLLKRRT